MPARPRHLRLLAAAGALSFLAAACGDDDDSGDDPTIEAPEDDGATDEGATDEATDEAADDGGGGESTGGDICSVLSGAELQAAAGSVFDAGEATRQDENGGDQCVWANTDAPPVKVITLVRYTTEGLADSPTGQAAEDAAAFYELNRDAVTPDAELELGDEAFRSGTGIWLLDGDTLYYLSTTAGDSPDALAALETLASALVD